MKNIAENRGEGKSEGETWRKTKESVGSKPPTYDYSLYGAEMKSSVFCTKYLFIQCFQSIGGFGQSPRKRKKERGRAKRHYSEATSLTNVTSLLSGSAHEKDFVWRLRKARMMGIAKTLAEFGEKCKNSRKTKKNEAIIRKQVLICRK